MKEDEYTYDDAFALGKNAGHNALLILIRAAAE